MSYRAKIDLMKAREEMDHLYSELRKPFITAFMDGRNEHGTHLLIFPPSNVFCADSEAILESFRSDFEKIFTEAESMGHGTGHAIAITLRWIGEEYGCHFWEYEGISPALTAAFFGDAATQEYALTHDVHNAVQRAAR